MSQGRLSHEKGVLKDRAKEIRRHPIEMAASPFLVMLLEESKHILSKYDHAGDAA